MLYDRINKIFYCLHEIYVTYSRVIACMSVVYLMGSEKVYIACTALVLYSDHSTQFFGSKHYPGYQSPDMWETPP